MGLAFGHILSRFQDAVLTPDAWPDALRLLTDAIGTAGAAYFVADKRTGEVTRASFSGMSVTPLPPQQGEDRPLVLILVTDPETRAPLQGDLAALFGLSPAEGRLAAAALSTRS